MPGIQLNTNRNFLKVVGGNLVKEVEEGTENARKRSWEAGGKKGVKHELVYSGWEGVIRNIEIKEMDFGKVCNITFDDAIISLGINGRYFADFASKIFNADLAKPILFWPYSIEVAEGVKTGVSLKQDGEKLNNYFYDFEKKEQLHDFPAPDEKQKDKKGYWKFYFEGVAEFLCERIGELKFEKMEAGKEDPFEGLGEPPTNAPEATGSRQTHKTPLDGELPLSDNETPRNEGIDDYPDFL